MREPRAAVGASPRAPVGASLRVPVRRSLSATSATTLRPALASRRLSIPLAAVVLAVASGASCSSGGGSSTSGDAGVDAAAEGSGGASGAGGADAAEAAVDAGSGDGAATDGAGGSGGGGFLEGSLDAPRCVPPTPEGTCGAFPQCGCGVGDKCDLLDLKTGRTHCVRDGSALPFQSCAPFLNVHCAAGSVCVFGGCKPLCAETSDCLGAASECREIRAVVSGMEVVVPGSKACTAGCDPVAPGDVCGPGMNCLFLDTVTECITAGSGRGPGACSSGNASACAPGYLCVGNPDTMTQDCLAWCRIGMASDCDTSANEICTPLTSTPTQGGVQYGVCVAP